MSKFIEEIKHIDCGNYYLTYQELIDMADEFGVAVLKDSLEMFKAGFIKGKRAERAEKKKRQGIACKNS